MALEKNNLLLAVLPPKNKSPEEVVFWCEVARCLKERGIVMFHVGTRILPTDDAVSLILPREPLAYNSMKKIPAEIPEEWVTGEYLESVLEREFLRGTAREKSPEACTGLARLANLSESILKTLKPGWILTWDKVIHVCGFFYLLGRKYGVSVNVAEKAPINDYLWLEKEGLHGESGLWKNPPPDDMAEYAETGRKFKMSLIENVYGFRRPGGTSGEEACLRKEPAGNGRPVFFLPLDTVYGGAWLPRSHPLSELRYPLWENPADALIEIQSEVRKLNGRLLLRKHPTCRYVRPGMIPDGIEIVEGDLAETLKTADVVICFCTKVAFPALALEKPVVTLSPNIAACSGAAYHCPEKENLYRTLSSALKKENFAGRMRKFEPFLGWLGSRYFLPFTGSPGEGARALVAAVTGRGDADDVCRRDYRGIFDEAAGAKEDIVKQQGMKKSYFNRLKTKLVKLK